MAKYNNTFNQKLHKEFCEICGCTDSEVLHHHHIVERVEVNTSNHPYNIAIICSNCHNLLHQGNGKLKIIGVYPSTSKHGRQLIYELNGKKNIDIDEPYFNHKPQKMKVFFDEE